MATDFTIQPPRLGTADHKTLAAEVDKWLPRIYTAHATLDSTAIKGPTTGVNFSMNTGSESVTGSKTGIASGLSVVDRVIVTLDNDATATNFTLTARVNPDDASKFDLYIWMPTAAGDTTPIAATTGITVNWLALGIQDV